MQKQDIDQFLVEKLRRLEQTENGKMGVSCVRAILRAMDRNNLREAQIIFSNEGDKVRQYPEIDRTLRDLLGCRMHSRKNCEDSLCAYMYQAIKGP